MNREEIEKAKVNIEKALHSNDGRLMQVAKDAKAILIAQGEYDG